VTTTTPHGGNTDSSNRGRQRRERLLFRWRLSTVVAATIAVAAVVAILIAALSLGGFGVPTDASPQPINSGAVPFGLLSNSSPPVPSNPNHNKLSQHVILYFVGPIGHLVAADALIDPPVSPTSTLNELLNGPAGALNGQQADLQTAIPSGTTLYSVKIASGLATIDLSSDIESASGQQLIQAFAQLVYTVTSPSACPVLAKKISKLELPPTTTTTVGAHSSANPLCADKVLFKVSGAPVLVPTETGEEASQAVSRANYASLY
jgi:Sporulation and spore germination